MWSDLRYRLRALFDRRAMERELDDELRFHLERETEKHVRAGIPRGDAERLARLAFGGVNRIKDDARDARGVSFVDLAAQDLRYAWRGLRAKPGFALAIVLTLGLGIGANTAMFGITDRLLFRPPAYLGDADRTHRVFLSYQWDGEERTEQNFPYTRFLDLQRNVGSFELMAAFGDRELAVGTGDEAREMTVAMASGTFFRFFDARPALGRFFTPAEDTTPVGAFVAVLGHGFWQTRYGGRRDVIGQSITIGNQVFSIIGVAPPGFVGLSERATPIAFLPITTYASHRGPGYFQDYRWQWAEVLVRRKPGVSLAAANADLTNAWARSWDKEYSAYAARGRKQPSAAEVGVRASAEPVLSARGPSPDANARIVKWVMGVTVIVLLVACANVANLLLARALGRRREIALRIALGVTRRRLLQQLLTESLLLAVLGGIAGVAVAGVGARLLRTLFLAGGEGPAAYRDGRTLVFVLVATLLVALFTGLVPALQTLRGDVTDALKSGAREGTYRRSRLRMALLVFQGAFSVVLLVGAGLFVRSLINVRSMRLGYDVKPIIYVEGNLRGTTLSEAQGNQLADRLVATAASIPGVEAATITSSVPFYSFEGRGAPIVPGRDSVSRLGRFILQVAGPQYFRTLGTRIVKGRALNAQDTRGAPMVIVVNEAMANALWPGQDALGKQLRFPGENQPWLTVVGVSENMRGGRLTGAEEFWYYLAIEQYKMMFGPSPAGMFVRVAGPAEDHVEQVRRRLQAEMPGNGYVTAVPLGQLVAGPQRSWRFGASMFAAFGGLALLLASIGLYSVIAYTVAQRTHELGVRIALGAGVRDVVRMIVGQGIAFATAGVVIGSVIALWAGRWVEPLLFRQRAHDPVVFLLVAGVLVTVAVIATLRPAVRATRVDPTVALRAE